MAEGGWFVVETDESGKRFLAHWTQYRSKAEAQKAIPRLNLLHPVGPLSAMRHDGKSWVETQSETEEGL